MLRLLWNVSWSCMATMVLLAALTPAYAPPPVRAPPRPVEVRPSPQEQLDRPGDEKQSNSRSNRAAREFNGWMSRSSANEGHLVAEGLRPSRYLALLDIVRGHPLWSRLDIANWRLAKEPQGAEEIYHVLELTDRTLPPPELAVFLDPILFKGARAGIALGAHRT